MNDDQRARSFEITTRALCAEQGRTIAGPFLVAVVLDDGEKFSEVVTTSDLLVMYADLAPEVIDLYATSDEHPVLLDLIGPTAASLH